MSATLEPDTAGPTDLPSPSASNPTVTSPAAGFSAAEATSRGGGPGVGARQSPDASAGLPQATSSRWLPVQTGWALAVVQALGVLASSVLIKTVAGFRKGFRYGWEGLIQDLLFFHLEVLGALICFVMLLAVYRLLRSKPGLLKLARGLSWPMLLLTGGYIGLNLLGYELLSSPLTLELYQMSGELGDFGSSLTPFLTARYLVPMGVATLLPLVVPPLFYRLGAGLARRLPTLAARGGLTLASLLLLFMVAGMLTPHGTENEGLIRAPLYSLPESVVRSFLQTSSEQQLVSIAFEDRSVSEPGPVSQDLSALKGKAAGMNLVLVVLESTPALYLKPYGATTDPMPAVSALSQKGMTFERYYSVTPTSMKCLFSISCGLYPYPRAQKETLLNPRIPCQSLGEVLAGQGYRGLLIHSGNFAYSYKDRFFRDRGYDTMIDAANMPEKEKFYQFSWGVDERAALHQFEHYIDQDKGKPFIFQYIPVFPHHPYSIPSPEFLQFGIRTQFNQYQNTLYYVDSVVMSMYRALQSRGLAEKTLFVVTGDHGEAFQQHKGNVIHSNYIYEENVHMPLFMINPTLFPEPVRVDTIGDHTDLAPTVLDLMGIPRPDRWQGQSLLSGEKRMAFFFTDYAFRRLGLRDGNWKYLWELQRGQEELYDLATDPKEKVNLVTSQPKLVAQFKARLNTWYRHQQALIPQYLQVLIRQKAAEKATEKAH